MPLCDQTTENFAELFYHYHNALAPDFGCDECTQVDWKELTSNERRRAIAAARLAVLELQSEAAGNMQNIFTTWPSGGTEGRDCGC